jgi:hypothetical protein
MQRKLLTLVATAALVAFLAGTAASADEPARAYVGLKKCKMCHKKEDKGNQYGQWLETGHAKAFETLGSDKALEKGKEIGVENPQADERCLKCHVTGYGVDAELGLKLVPENGVTCESCHGAGGDYYKKKVMQGIADGKKDRDAVGLIKPDEAVCLKCHNEDNPFHEGFDYDTAFEKIAHPRPDKG